MEAQREGATCPRSHSKVIGPSRASRKPPIFSQGGAEPSTALVGRGPSVQQVAAGEGRGVSQPPEGNPAEAHKDSLSAFSPEISEPPSLQATQAHSQSQRAPEQSQELL